MAEPHPDMNIKVAAFTVSEKSSNTGAGFGDQTDNFYFNGNDCLKEKKAKCIEV